MDQERNSNESNENNKVTPIHQDRQPETNEQGIAPQQQQHLEAFQAFL
ncbi:MAG TPA: YbjN domain-containing protein, partial [Exiguobacterium sp.]|nr:YbjN domain-containing protein [Exiguobacterium sp.]